MDFARKQLEKYGWEEGKGLGRHENGIATAIKPNLKFDNAGFGHEAGKDFTNNWWENVYNNASKNVEIKKSENDIKMNTVANESIEITTKGYSVRDFKKNNNLEFGTFMKTSKLTASGEEKYDNVAAPEATNLLMLTSYALTDEELFAACEGRTAHKGARHGLKMNGKLSRIEKQEKILLKKLQKVSITDEDNSKMEKKLKKLSKIKINDDKEESPSIDQLSKKKKKKKKRKSVSFNETVTEYIHTQDPDPTTTQPKDLEPPIILQTRIKDRESNEDTFAQDEGIEQDCDMKSEDMGQQSFEEVQSSKKKKKDSKRSTATGRFLNFVFHEVDANDKFKRKHDEDAELLDKQMKRCESFLTFKKKKKKRIEEKTLNSIAASLDQVCKISESK